MPARRLAPVLVVALAALLAGCSSATAKPSTSAAASGGTAASAGASASATPSASTAAGACLTPGAASTSVKVSGAFDAAPTVTFPKKTAAAATQRSVVTAGSGAKVVTGDSVRIALSIYDGATGKKAAAVGYGGKSEQAVAADPDAYIGGVAKSLVCSTKGSRLVVVAPPSDAFGSNNAQLGFGATDSLVFVVDVLSIVAHKGDKVTGTAKSLPSGFPAVTVAASGVPSVRIPAAKAPTTLKIATRIAGKGDTVKTGDVVTAEYQGTLWRTGKVFDQSWGREPADFAVPKGVIAGFSKAMIGQKVGSQVVVIIPPADGYGKTGSSDGTIKATDVLVFVIDILGTTHP